MRYIALATDYDGTLAADGRVRPRTFAALEQLRASGRRAILVTGRELDDLQSVCPRLDLFDLVVVENGAVLWNPRTREERVLAEPPPPELHDRLHQRGAYPLSAGRVIVATREPHQIAAVEAIRELGLEWQVIFNKGAVMLLPTGVNKQTGLAAALHELQLSPRNTVCVGDAENDHAMLTACECGVAVANALKALKDHADLVLRAPRGDGVEELIGRLLADDLRSVMVPRHALLLGVRRDGTEVRMAPAGRRVLIAGPSGSGKTTAAVGFLERVIEAGYQCCVIDPEGDYQDFEGLVTLGTSERAPTAGEVLELLHRPEVNAGVCLLGLKLEDRPGFFARLLPRIQEMRGRTGRPHWLVIDEAHHLLPESWHPAPMTLPRELGSVILITIHPERVSKAMTEAVDTVLAAGREASRTLSPMVPGGEVPEVELNKGEVLCKCNGLIEPISLVPGSAQHRRHRRKYAAGDLDDEAFIFRGPQGKLSLRATNLTLFLQMAEGVDADTWQHHLRQRDYSRWFRDAIKDEDLAAEAERIERDGTDGSRELIRAAIEKRYTLPE